jgi:hypothetical protein
MAYAQHKLQEIKQAESIIKTNLCRDEFYHKYFIDKKYLSSDNKFSYSQNKNPIVAS